MALSFPDTMTESGKFTSLSQTKIPTDYLLVFDKKIGTQNWKNPQFTFTKNQETRPKISFDFCRFLSDLAKLREIYSRNIVRQFPLFPFFPSLFSPFLFPFFCPFFPIFFLYYCSTSTKNLPSVSGLRPKKMAPKIGKIPNLILLKLRKLGVLKFGTEEKSKKSKLEQMGLKFILLAMVSDRDRWKTSRGN